MSLATLGHVRGAALDYPNPDQMWTLGVRAADGPAALAWIGLFGFTTPSVNLPVVVARAKAFRRFKSRSDPSPETKP